LWFCNRLLGSKVKVESKVESKEEDKEEGKEEDKGKSLC